MKNFDEGRVEPNREDLQFILHGATFQRRHAVRPEVLTEFDAIGADTKPGEVLAIADRLILSFIEPEGHERWRTLRERDDDPVTLEEMLNVCEWVIGESTGRPTTPPSGSTAESETAGTGTSSTESSSLPEAEASTT